MNTEMCETCAYFRQHYTLCEGKIFRVYCGHCTFSRVKHKRPDTKSCEDYVPAQPGEGAFATKEYLSKALLEYVLGLELLPEIDNLEEKRKKRRGNK